MLLLVFLFFSENKSHGKTDYNREHDSPNNTCDTHFYTKYPRREDDGKHADSRSGIQESYGRPQTGTALVDAGEQWKYGA